MLRRNSAKDPLRGSEGIKRMTQLLANPKSSTAFEAGDRIGIIGNSRQVRAIKELISPDHREIS